MSSTITEEKTGTSARGSAPKINDAVIKIATKNGSGSQSANLILLRAIFSMGIPVSGKNLFPSNIAGLPTWFTIRANENGWLAQRTRSDIVVAMNEKTIEEDLRELEPGTTAIINESLKRYVTRDDLRLYEVPFSTLVKEACPDTRLRKRVVNLVYVGVLAWLLDLEFDEIEAAINHQFSTKPAAAKINLDAARVGYEWGKATCERLDNIRLQRSDSAKDKIIIEGNEATALGLLFGGASVVAWYPITPSSSVCEYLTDYFHKYRIDPETGKATFAVVQAEDEIASIGIVLGAGWAGARSVTATSGPGISLMGEMAGLSYFAEIPAVIIDVQRMGPSTGLPTRTCQGDIASAYQLSHGDCRHVLLIPGTVQECFEFSSLSLELAEHLQTLVFVMSDLDLGMNKWMADSFDAPEDGPLARGKVLSAEDLERLGGFERYRDVDGDGVPYRTLPGTDHEKAPYFTRGTGHNAKSDYTESSKDWKENIDRLAHKFETARGLTPRPIVDEPEGASIGIIAYGSSHPAIEEARHLLLDDQDIATSYLRIRALPCKGEIRDFIDRYDSIYLVEQNRDAQMAGILSAEFPDVAAKIQSILHYDGMPIDAEFIVGEIATRQAERFR